MNGACNGIFFCPAPWGPGEESKGQISLNINYKDFYTKLFVCSHKLEIQTYQIGFLFYCLIHAPEVGFLGAGVPRRSKNSNKVMWHIKLTGMTSKTECK